VDSLISENGSRVKRWGECTLGKEIALEEVPKSFLLQNAQRPTSKQKKAYLMRRDIGLATVN